VELNLRFPNGVGGREDREGGKGVRRERKRRGMGPNCGWASESACSLSGHHAFVW